MAKQAGYVGAVYLPVLKALQFDAVGENVSVTSVSSLNFAAAASFSLEAWIKVSATGDGLLISKTTGTLGVNLLGYRLYVASNKLVFAIGDATAQSVITSDADINDAAWHHVLAVRDVTNDKLYLYIDGADAYTGDVTDTTTGTLSNSAALAWGSTDTGNTRLIGPVRLYSNAVSAADAAKLAGGNYPNRASNTIVGEWLGLKDTGSSLVDSGPSGLAGTITSATWADTKMTVTGEAVDTGDGTTVDYTLDHANADDIVIKLGGTAQPWSAFSILSVKGTIQFVTAPGVVAITADYVYYPVLMEVGGFFEWSVDRGVEALDTTDFASGQDKEVLAGPRNWTGSAQRHWEHTGFQTQLGTRAIVKFYLDDDPLPGHRLEGWGLIMGLRLGVSVEALVNETIEFQGNHGLTVETT